MIKREIYQKIKSHLTSDQITLITGPRQCGKTTLIQTLKKELEEDGHKTLYLNLDRDDDLQLLESQSIFIENLKLELGEKERAYVFIDEIQVKSDAGRFLKGVFDSKLNYKFIVTGSGSVELKEKISESLLGRKRVFSMNTLTFREYINYKTDYKYAEELSKFLELKGNGYLEEYMKFGGYPRVVIANTIEEKLEEITEIYTSFLEKDIQKLLKIKKTLSLSKQLTYLAASVGSYVNHSSISDKLDIDQETVKTYLYYLEKTFILYKAYPYHTNPITEITKSPSFYFRDLGMRNFVYNRFTRFDLLLEGGILFENFIYKLIKDITKIPALKLNFWRTKDAAEVDIVLSAGIDAVPVEVKYKNYKNSKISRSMRSYINRYKPRKAYIINLKYKDEVVIGETKVLFTPYYELLDDEFSFF